MDRDLILAATAELETPVGAVDVRAMEVNLASMQALAQRLGARLRPHAKTHKSAEVARRQLAHGASGLTSATLQEAEAFARAGARDLLLCQPPVGAARLRRLQALAEQVDRLAVSLDSVEVAALLPESVDVLWEVDTGHHRLGTPPGAQTAGAVAKLVAAVGEERFRGLLTFPGHAYSVAGGAQLATVARTEWELMVATAGRVRAAGFAVRELSIGSTPTIGLSAAQRAPDGGDASLPARVPEGAAAADRPTELRPGAYVYGDAQQVALGAMSVERCALGVVATVIATPAPDRAVLDAGSKALAADRSVSWLQGYARVVGRDDLVLDRMSEEHGVLVAPDGDTRLRIGDRVVCVPVHCCTTVNLHPALLMVEAGHSWWDPVEARGWRAGEVPGASG